MLTEIRNLPEGVVGVEAHGKVVKDDYEKVLVPIVELAYKEGRRIKFLYHLTPDFSGFSAGAAWDDAQIGLRYLRLFQACAVVTDTDWITKSTQLAGFLMPCPVKVFKNSELQSAIGWLSSSDRAHSVEAKLIPEKGVLVLEPNGSLGHADFEYLASIVDPWVEQHGRLNGLVLHAKQFPGWENLGSMAHHIRFVREHHKKVKRIAVAAEGKIFEILPKLGAHFVDAEIKNFDYKDFEVAVEWASRS